MTTTEKKEQFIILRAEGLSYSKIASQLHISKSTCSKWEKTLSQKIRTAREGRLEDLFKLYRISREEHIKKLGDVLTRIEKALEKADLTTIAPEKLLKLKLEYEEKLQAQHTEPIICGETFKENSMEGLLQATGELYERIKAGNITPQQAKAELTALEGVRRSITDSITKW